MKKLEFVGQVIDLICTEEINMSTFDEFLTSICYLFPVLTEDIDEKFLYLLYEDLTGLMG